MTEETQQQTEVKMRCPICSKAVTKLTITDHHVKNKIICENEEYCHYDDDKLIKYKSVAEYRAPEEKIFYAPFPEQKSIFFA